MYRTESKIKLTILFVINMLFLLTCSKFDSGDCVVATDGYIWKINNAKDYKYSASGYSENGWGNDVNLDYDILDKTHNKINCPVIRK